MMYLVSRSLVQGVPAGLISLCGVITGFLIYIFATAVGLAVVFTTVPAAFWVLKAAGACYLLWLALGIVRGKRSAFKPQSLPPHSPRRLYAMGLTTCLLNPKIALMYLALFPQFVDSKAGHTALQIVQLGLVQALVAGLVNAGWVLAAGGAARLLAKSATADRVVRYLTGAMLTFFAVHLGLAPS
jgi:threonine/homoserine/homoserine lactone efflux protein